MEATSFEKSLHSFQRRRPFQAFTIALVNGDRFELDHPEALVVRSGVAGYIDPDGTPILFDHQSISQLAGETVSKRRTGVIARRNETTQ